MSQTAFDVSNMVEMVKIIKTDSQTKGTGEENVLKKPGDLIPTVEVSKVSGSRNGHMTFS